MEVYEYSLYLHMVMSESTKYRTLVLITDSFPYGGITEQMFVMPEMQDLSREFERVVVMPTIAIGPRFDIAFPDNVEISAFWLEYPDWKSRFRRSRFVFMPEIWKMLKGSVSYSSMTYALAAKTFSNAIQSWMKRESLDWDSTLFYTFWLDLATSGLALAARRHGVNFFTRAHGHDVYMDRASALRRFTVEKSKAVFTAGCVGEAYLKSLYPESAGKIAQRRLGSIKYDRTLMSCHHVANDRIITFLSVSRVDVGKRVELNFMLLKALAIARPSTVIRWIHVGSGPEFDRLCLTVSEGCPDNLSIDMRGALPNEEVHKIYSTEAIDWFMLLSDREGLPIAVCESFSYGVPVVATDVEGSHEAVDDECGLLLDKNPAVEEFIRGIVPYLDSDYRMEQLRQGAFRRWSEFFDASALRHDFVKEIIDL